MEIDTDSWYRLTTLDDPQRSLIGTYPYMNGDTGLVSITNTDDSSTSQQWQLFSIGPSRYMLRTKASGIHGYLTTKSGNGTCEESTLVISTQTDRLVSWVFEDVHDGAGLLSLEVGKRKCTFDISDGGGVRLTADATHTHPITLVRINNIDEPAYLAVATRPVTRVRGTTLTTTVLSSSSIAISTLTSISTLYPPSSSPSSFPLHPPAANKEGKLSPFAAMGIGIAIGIVGILILLSITLLLYRRRKLRRSQHHRQAKLWKGFEPVTPSTARTTFVGNKTASACFRDLPTPVTPAFLPSPPLERDEEGARWGSRDRVSWLDMPMVSPVTPGSPPVGMSGT
jgi:hypothetical protein